MFGRRKRQRCVGDGDLATDQARCAAASSGRRRQYIGEFQRMMAGHDVIRSDEPLGPADIVRVPVKPNE
jgi:hypothetical protein